MDKFSFVGNADVNAIDEMYERYKNQPESVDIGWAKFFEGFDFAKTDFESDGEIPQNFQKEFKIINLINAYRSRGHLFTKTNPVRERRKYEPTLAIENFGLEEADLNTVFQAGNEVGIGPATLKDIIAHLQEAYCQSIGIEYVYMREPDRLEWFRNAIELKNRPKYNNEEKIRILRKLNEASGFEQFLQKKYVGQKRFSLEGGEALIPALDKLIEKGAELGVEEFVMGMAHRGRLSTLVNVFGKNPRSIFSEFEGKEFEDDETFDGDVKYHLGYSTDLKVNNNKKVHVTLAPNPSHLEAVDPVVQGIARAKIDNKLKDEKKIIPVMIHGDAAVAGQGVVYEVVQMAQLDGYRAGGTIHIVINNQVGFTTNYLDARSSTYCTDVFKTTLCPVFHVNGDDVEAVVQAIEICVEYRQKYNRDVVLDLLCYRKFGHNEGDEPKFTQPKLYKIIEKHPNPKDIYLNQLIQQGVIDAEQGKKIDEEIYNFIDEKYEEAKADSKTIIDNFLGYLWKDLRMGNAKDFLSSPETGMNLKVLTELANKVATLPEGPKYFRKIIKLLEDRKKMIVDNRLDWGMAEMIAYATLLIEGYSVRISGQDVERGTFSHRHAVVKTEDDEDEIITLNLLDKKQGEFYIYNSLLSEYAVLGFEYGYSLATPNGLVIWEAQFGDFYNGAQIMVDQFITAGEDKWRVQSGLTMLLPHGYEGQGGEHSSARIERFLQQAADLNMQVCNSTTPANHYHLLRRQLKRDFRKPLVVFSPKNLLRHPKATSTMEDLAKGKFMEVIDDATAKVDKVDTIVFCSGKFYYEIIEQIEENKLSNAAVVRIEQLYPFPQNQIDDIFKKYKKANNIIWAQEEPENMGPWSYIFMRMKRFDLKRVSRPSSAAPATGSSQTHKKRLANLYKSLIDTIKGN